jgi:hypothetical protein
MPAGLTTSIRMNTYGRGPYGAAHRRRYITIGELPKAAERIGDVVNLHRPSPEQTNLLAPDRAGDAAKVIVSGTRL